LFNVFKDDLGSGAPDTIPPVAGFGGVVERAGDVVGGHMRGPDDARASSDESLERQAVTVS
jgi:hypothetical protein